MSQIRFVALAVGLFGIAFVGMSWMNKGMPVMAMRVEPLKPSAGLPTFEESVQKGIRKDWENSKTSQSDGDKDRDKLRLALMQASTAYKLSPCDPTMKKNLVEAVTNYTSAWGKMAGCSGGRCSGYDAQIDLAAKAFNTPADKRIHQTLREAYEQGGIEREDFPKSVRNDIYLFSGMPFGGPEAACIIARSADNKR
jgi:hypothetical protein